MDKIWHSPEDHDTKNCIRSNEEILAELRRENFRLRLMLYNYEQVYHRSNNSDDPESPRIYAAECENVILRKLIDEKQLLLKEASKIIDTLKKENSRLEGIINDIQNKNEKAEIDWRNKYDDLYSELQQSREEIQSRDMKILSKDAELNRKRNDLESYISELQNRLEISESLNCQYKREIRLFQTEADSLRTTLENVNQEQSSFKITDLATDPIRSIDIHDLCKEHFNELSNMIHVLSKQITDVGLKPEVSFSNVSEEFGESHPASHGPSDSVIRDLSHMMTELPNLHNNEATSDLTDRLHSARLLILELVNEKLRLDKLLATISSSHERALAVLKEKCCTVESHMSMQAQFHDEELSRRDSEIKRLNEHINIIIKQLENSLLTRDKVQSELSIVREQLERSKYDQSKLQEQLLLELRGKENTTYRFDSSMLPWTNALDSVAQFSSLNIFSHEELLSMKSLVTGFNGENKYELQNQPDLSVSLSEDQAKTYSIVSDIENCKIRDRTDGTNEVKMVNNQVALPNDIGELQKELTLVRKQLRDQIQAMSRLKMEYDLLAGNTHLGSLISDNVTSVTKDISVNSRTSSAIGSVGDLPTVSTPPGNLGSPVFPEILGSITQDNANNLLNTCDLTNPNNSASSHIENSMPVVLNRENEITDRNHSSVYPKLTISDVFNHITVIPEEQEVVNEQDNKKSRFNQFTPENSISIGVSNEPNSLYRLRNLYDLVHDLKLKLDNVRFTQHSFVEMINHSLSTAGIDTSLRVPFTPNEVEDSVRHSLSVVCDDKSFEESGRMLSDHAKVIHESTEITNKTPCNSGDSYINNAHEDSVLNETVAELWGGCPKSPVRLHEETANLKNKSKHPVVQKAVSKIKGLSLKSKISCLPQIKDKNKNLIGSATICENGEDSQQDSIISKGLSRSFNVGENYGDIFDKRHTEVADVGELTIVEWEHKDIFERLAHAMSRLRDAIDECSDVSSAFWDVDIKKNLSALLTSHLESNHSVDGRNSARRPINVGNMVIDTTRSNNSSHQLTNVSDAAAAAAPDYDSIDFFGQNTDEVKSSQLYGPVWLQPENNNDQTNVYWRQLENELTRVNHERDQLTLKLQEVTDKLIRVQEDNSYLEHEFKSLHCSSSLPLTDVNDEYPPTDILLKNNHLETVDKAIQLETNLIICENDASHQYKKLKDELHKRDETIHRLELDRLYIMKKLSLLNSDDTCCTNMIELIDTVVTEMSTSRTLIRDLKHHISEFERRLDDCIPTGEYYQLKEQVDSLRLELNQVYSQVDHYKSTLEFVSTTLEPLLCIEKSLPFNELIDNIVDKFQRQDALINSLSTERDIAFNTIKSYITASVQPIPNSLIKCIEIIGNDSSHFHSLVNNLELDRQQAMDLIKKMAPVEKNLHTISDYVNWFIHLFNKTQNKLNDMEQLYEETKNSLSVSIEKFEKFELIIKSLDKKLNTCQYRLKCCQSELVQVTETCIPLDVHNNILKNLQTVEKLCSEFQSKNLEYEQKLQTIIGIIGSTLSKTIEPNNLKDDVMEICSSLTSYRNASNSADQRCKEWEVKFEKLNNSYTEQITKIDQLQCTISNKDAKIKALTETSTANHKFIEELEIELSRLREEHMNCPAQHELINVQTSPIIRDWIQDAETEISTIHLRTDQTVNTSLATTNNLRLQKYCELRTAAFEIKKKLIQRTEKLESALEEVARLRSVIQQDKERANITLKEVEDLREQVIRKNRKIQNLEAKVAKLHASSSAKNDIILSKTRSPCHTLSDQENPRGPICRHTDQMTKLNRYSLSSVVHCDHLKPLSDCTNILTLSYDSISDNTPSLLLESEAIHLSNDANQMNQCEDFTDLLNNLQYLINELKRHINIQTYMKCCYSENSLDLINDDRCAIVQPQHSKSWISDTRVKLSTLMNQRSNINHTNLKSYVESLRRTHYKLRQLSGRMDQLCSKFIHQCNKQFTCQSKLSTTDCLQQTADLLGTVIKRLHVIFDRSDVYVDNSTTQDVFQDLNKVLDNIAYYSSTINS